jgi:hypothetical protein
MCRGGACFGVLRSSLLRNRALGCFGHLHRYLYQWTVNINLYGGIVLFSNKQARFHSTICSGP